MATHNDLGKFGEKQAEEYLISKGYKIRHTNWQYGKYELDIVTEKGDEIIIVEVKTRSTDYFGRPSEAVNRSKMQRTVQAADHYIRVHDLNLYARFDIISIVTAYDGSYQLEHIENAFYPTMRLFQRY